MTAAQRVLKPELLRALTREPLAPGLRHVREHALDAALHGRMDVAVDDFDSILHAVAPRCSWQAMATGGDGSSEVRHHVFGEGPHRFHRELVRRRARLHHENELVDADLDEPLHRLARGTRIADDRRQLRAWRVAALPERGDLIVGRGAA